MQSSEYQYIGHTHVLPFDGTWIVADRCISIGYVPLTI